MKFHCSWLEATCILSLQLPDTSAGGMHTTHNGKICKTFRHNRKTKVTKCNPRACFKSAPSMHKNKLAA